MFDLSSKKKALMESFILLAYSDILNKRTYDLIGVGDDRKRLKGYNYDIDKKDYISAFTYNHDKDIHLVIPADFTGEGTTCYLLVTKKNDGSYSNEIYRRGKEGTIEVGDTNAVPVLYASPDDLHPQLLLQQDNGLISVRIKPDGSVETDEEFKDYGELHEDHTSAFVSLDASMKAYLCLVLEEDSKKVLRILPTKREEGEAALRSLPKIDLPDDIGPLVFEDFNGNGVNDMAFVCCEGSSYMLRIYSSSGSESGRSKNAGLIRGCLNNLHKEVNISKEFPGLTPVLKSDDEFGEIPYGIFTADLRAKGRPDFFFIMKDKDGDKKVVALENHSTPSEFIFKVPDYNKELSAITNVISISCCDYNNTGREAVFINRIDEDSGKPMLYVYQNNLSKENLKLSISTILPKVGKQKYGSGIPGVSYLLENKDRTIIANQMSYSSFVHLKHPATYIGLGTMSFIIDTLVIGVPGYGDYAGLYKIDSVVIPNTDLIVYIKEKGDYSVEAHFFIGDHFKTVIGVLITVAGANLIFVLVLQYRDRRRVVKAKDMDKLHPLFSTLQ